MTEVKPWRKEHLMTPSADVSVSSPGEADASAVGVAKLQVCIEALREIASTECALQRMTYWCYTNQESWPCGPCIAYGALFEIGELS
jgi:hypothetical protein